MTFPFHRGLFLGVAVSVLMLCLAAPFSGAVENRAVSAPDITAHPSCPLCGMDRARFAHSRVLITHADASTAGFCSLHCAALDLALHLDDAPVRIQVADKNTRELVDADAAFWVLGGKSPGVMTRSANWAFAKTADAEAFASAEGGTLGTFEDALRAAYANMYDDTRMIREKRARKATATEPAPAVDAPPPPGEKDRCPVCGMFVAPYPAWVAVVSFKDGERLYFDGAKDMFKFRFDVGQWRPGKSAADISALHVTEYYGLKLVPAEAAWFVLGADVLGPMGRELIPLASPEDAAAFRKDHRGERILRLDEVTPGLIQSLDAPVSP